MKYSFILLIFIFIFFNCAVLKINQKQISDNKLFNIFFQDFETLYKESRTFLKFSAPVVNRLGYLQLKAPILDLYEFAGTPTFIKDRPNNKNMKFIYWADSLAACVVSDTVKAIVTSSKKLPAEDGYIRVGDTIERLIKVYGDKAVESISEAHLKKVRLKHCGAWFLLSPYREILMIGIYSHASNK